MFTTLQMDGAEQSVIVNTAGWHRLVELRNVMQSAILHIKHQYNNAGPCDMLVYVSCDENYAVQILSSTFRNNVVTIDDLRLTRNGTTGKYYLDIHYQYNADNGICVDIIGTTAQVGWEVDITRMNLESVDTLPDGETVVKTAEWENPPMLLGVEYRTTERYLGKPVYVKTIDFGALPNATQKVVQYGDDTTRTIRACAVDNYGEIISGGTGYVQNFAHWLAMSTDNKNVGISCSGDATERTGCIVTVWYYKTTD